MSIDARQDIDQLTRMVDNLLELADEAIEEGSAIDPEQVKDMAQQIQELMSEIFERNFESWGSDSEEEEGSYFDGEE